VDLYLTGLSGNRSTDGNLSSLLSGLYVSCIIIAWVPGSCVISSRVRLIYLSFVLFGYIFTCVYLSTYGHIFYIILDNVIESYSYHIMFQFPVYESALIPDVDRFYFLISLFSEFSFDGNIYSSVDGCQSYHYLP